MSLRETSSGDFVILKDAISAHLQIIDATLGASEVPLRIRPLDAATMFVNEYLIAVSGDGDKENFHEKPWFAVLYHEVKEWYRETYGAAFEREDESRTATGIVLVRGLPVELRVPLTRGKVETPGETAWLFFPIEVEEGENPLDWLVSPPAIEKLGANERPALVDQAVKVASALRSIRMNLMGVTPTDAVISGFLDGVLAEIEGAARQILRNDATVRGSALWSLQMAAERSLKALSQQKTGSFKESHDLFYLFDRVNEYLVGVPRDILKRIPRVGQIVNDRYGLRGAPSLYEVVDTFNAVVSLVSQISFLFGRELNLGGAGFLFKRPPWTSLPTITPPTSVD
ncbi:MAG: hypothetical protein WBW31_01195 [Candidatus Sulfotelmatobacter sp.]